MYTHHDTTVITEQRKSLQQDNENLTERMEKMRQEVWLSLFSCTTNGAAAFFCLYHRR